MKKVYSMLVIVPAVLAIVLTLVFHPNLKVSTIVQNPISVVIDDYTSDMLIDTIIDNQDSVVLYYRDYAAGEVGSSGPYIGAEQHKFVATTEREKSLLRKSLERRNSYRGRYMNLSLRGVHVMDGKGEKISTQQGLFVAKYDSWYGS